MTGSEDIRELTEDGFIVSNPAILGGTPCIRGTRLSVYAIAARLDDDAETAEDIVRENPWVSEAMVRAALEYAVRVPLVEHPDARPWRMRAKSNAAT